MTRPSYNILRHLLTQYTTNPQSLSKEQVDHLFSLMKDFGELVDTGQAPRLLGLSRPEIRACLTDSETAGYFMLLGGRKWIYDGMYYLWMAFVLWLGLWSLGWMKERGFMP